VELTLQSVAEGVPMICRPLGGDQMGNARYVCYQWKVGVMLAEAESPLTRGDVQVGVEGVMARWVTRKAKRLEEE
jgi:UDP-glucosyltransferase BX8/BX9